MITCGDSSLSDSLFSLDKHLSTCLFPSRCVEDTDAQSQRQLLHIKAVALREEEERESRTNGQEACLNRQEEEELSLDSHVVIRYHRGPVLIGQPIRMSVNLRSNFSAEFVVIRFAHVKSSCLLFLRILPTNYNLKLKFCVSSG